MKALALNCTLKRRGGSSTELLLGKLLARNAAHLAELLARHPYPGSG